MKRLHGFSLMEMMIVLTIVAVVAAASAPMVNKKMVRAASEKSPWVFTNGESIAYNLDNPDGIQDNKTARIGSGSDAPNGVHPRLYITTNSDATPHIMFGRNNNTNLMRLTAGGERNNIWFSNSNNVNARDSVVIGPGAEGSNHAQVIIGNNATATTVRAVAIGNNTRVDREESTAIGSDARATGGAYSTALGYNSRAQAGTTLALGAGAIASRPGSIAIGSVIGGVNTPVANRTNAGGENSIAFGRVAQSTGANSIALGSGAQAVKNDTIAIGRNANANPGAAGVKLRSIAIGLESQATNSDAVAIGTRFAGRRTTASGVGSTAIGSTSRATGDFAIAIGGSTDTTTDAASVTNVATTQATAEGAVAIGAEARATAANAVAIGRDSEATRADTIVLGNENTTVIIPGRIEFQNLVVRGNANIVQDLYVGGRTVLGLKLHGYKQRLGNWKGDTSLVWGSYTVDDNNHHKWVHAGGNDGHGNYQFAALCRIENEHAQQAFLNADRYSSESSVNVHSDITNITRNAFRSFYTAIREPLPPDFPSDRRLKNVGKTFVGGLAELKKLDLYNYTYKADQDKTPHVGVMAQDLQKVFPDAVVKGEDGFLRIRMEDMFYAVINAVKELDSRISLLEQKQKQIDELEKRVDKLEKRLADLEKKVK